jgi:hydrogenase maturation factor
VLNISTEFIRISVQSDDWKVRHTGYVYLSIISEACAQAFDENLDEVLKLAGSGVVDENLRVRVTGLE